MKKPGLLLKTSLLYTLGSILTRTLVFLATPVYIRFLSKAEYGSYSNFAAWMTIISMVSIMNLQVSVMRAKYDYEEDVFAYMKTICVVIFSFVAVIAFAFITNLTWIQNLLRMSDFQVAFLLIYLFLSPGYVIYSAYYRAQFESKKYLIVTAIYVISTVFVSLFLLMYTKNNKLNALIFGQVFAPSILGLYFLIKIFVKPGRITFEMIKSSLKIGIPMIPHLLGGSILLRSDKIMITHLVGEVETAYYAVGSNVVAILTVLSNSLNNAFVPWLTMKLNEGNNQQEIRKNFVRQVSFFGVAVLGLLLVAPEIILFMGGASYKKAVGTMVPLLLSSFFFHVYILYMNLEVHEKKTTWIGIATILAMCLNLILNYIFIPEYGFVAAAYTTLICYILVFLFHIYIVRIIGMSEVYNNNMVFLSSIVLSLSGIIIKFLFPYMFVRYVVLGALTLIGVVLSFRNRDMIKKMFSHR
ncbi:MAG TPA: oligosaccharide flippase family protein [Methanothermobacter sp.]|nr:oligosaccharide flippase family protein [Methanothermobacter sp.]